MGEVCDARKVLEARNIYQPCMHKWFALDDTLVLNHVEISKGLLLILRRTGQG